MGAVRIAAVAALMAVQMACTDGGAPARYGSHCDDYGPDFDESLESAANLDRQGQCSADPECRPQQGLYTFYTPYDPEIDFGPGWCQSFLLEYVACIPDVLADPNACPPRATSLPGGPTWGRPVDEPDVCYRLETPCMPAGWTDCADPGVMEAVICQ